MLKLKGRPVTLKITVVGGESKSIEFHLYQLTLYSPCGNQTDIEAYGIHTISTKIEAVNIDQIVDLLSVPVYTINCPQEGEIDLLVGQQYGALHPIRIK